MSDLHVDLYNNMDTCNKYVQILKIAQWGREVIGANNLIASFRKDLFLNEGRKTN